MFVAVAAATLLLPPLRFDYCHAMPCYGCCCHIAAATVVGHIRRLIRYICYADAATYAMPCHADAIDTLSCHAIIDKILFLFAAIDITPLADAADASRHADATAMLLFHMLTLRCCLIIDTR